MDFPPYEMVRKIANQPEEIEKSVAALNREATIPESCGAARLLYPATYSSFHWEITVVWRNLPTLGITTTVLDVFIFFTFSKTLDCGLH